MQFKDQKQTAQRNKANKCLSVRATWAENALGSSCEAEAGKSELLEPQTLEDFRGKQWGTDWLNSDDWLLITVLATSKIPAGSGYK